MVSKTYEARCWESNIERKNALKVLDMFWGEGNVEGLDILVQVLDLATTNDGEDVRSLLHHVCDSDYDRKSLRMTCRIGENKHIPAVTLLVPTSAPTFSSA